MAGALHDDAIDLPRFAEVMAHLRHFAEASSDDVIARLGLSKAAWAAATARWYAARDAELASGNTDLNRRFGRLFTKALQDLAKRKPSLESLGPVQVAQDDVQSHVQEEPPTPKAPSWSPPPPPPPPPPAPPAPAPPINKLGETVPVARDALKQSTPFLRRPAPAARPDETVGLAPGAGGAPTLPPGLPDLTLPQYASLRVELQTRPDAVDITLARYGLRHDTRDALEAHWRARFDADPLLRMEFVRAYATYLGWLREQRAG
jgi:hypothetical protein